MALLSELYRGLGQQTMPLILHFYLLFHQKKFIGELPVLRAQHKHIPYKISAHNT